MSEKILSSLVPEFRDKVAATISACAVNGVVMVPYYGIRSPWEQAKLWRKSRHIDEINKAIDMLEKSNAVFLAEILYSVGPQQGAKVTNALPGNSWHQWGEAVDCYWRLKGTIEWGDKTIDGVKGYKVYADEALALGLDAGYYWNSLKDSPHIQFRSTANPLKSGLSWSEINNVMVERFGSPSELNNNTANSVYAATTSTLGVQRTDVILTFSDDEGWNVYANANGSAIFYRSGMTINADGSPRAYHPDNIGIDYNANGGYPGQAWALAKKLDGTICIQGANDPNPGYFVSTTALVDTNYTICNPRRYVNSEEIPFIVLPRVKYKEFAPGKKIMLGDFGLVYNMANGLLVFVQFADTGPAKKLGEGSIATANALGIPSSPKNGGTSTRNLITVVFPGSGNTKPRSAAEIQQKGSELLQSLGGVEMIREISARIK